MKEEKDQQPVNPEPVKGDGEDVKIQGETSLLPELSELRTRHQALVEAVKAFGELLPMASVWIKEQVDYETNPFKQAMIASFYKVCNEKLLETFAEFREIEPRIMALAAKVQGAEAAKKEVPHGDFTENR